MSSKYAKKQFEYKRKAFAGSKTDYGIPTFSFKSSLIIIVAASIATFLVPYVLSFIGLSFDFGVIIGNAVITSFALAYSRYFIESKRGYCKGFFVTYGGFALAFCIIAFFWMYLNSYI